MDIVVYLRILRRHWKMIVAAAIVGALIGVGSTMLPGEAAEEQGRFYKATHTLFLDTSNVGDVVRPIYTNLDQIAVLVTTGEVPRRVAGQLGGDAADWTQRIFTVTNGTTNTLDLTCASRSEDEAVTCADTFAEELIASLEEREETRFNTERDETLRRIDELQNSINLLDAQIAGRPPNTDTLSAQRQSLFNQYRLAFERLQQLADQGGPSSIVSTLEPAEAQPISRAEYNNRIARGQLGENRIRADFSTDNRNTVTGGGSSGPRFSGPVSRGILGGLLGLLLGIGLAVITDRIDRRLRTREEVEPAFGMPVLAEVPTLSTSQQRQATLLSASAPLSRTAEAYRAVRSSLLFQRATDPRRHDDDAFVVLVSSAGPKEGKTTTSANLAAVFAEAGSRVLAINCDFRRPTLHQYFELPHEPRRVFESEVGGVWVITDVTTSASSANPALVVEEQRRIVNAARSRFDVIVVDTAPLLTTNDATEVMDVADVVVLVARSGVSTSDGAERCRELLNRIAAPVAGVVLLGSEATSNDYYYYYSRSRPKTKDAPVSTAVSTDGGLFGPDPTLDPEGSEPHAAT